MPPAGSARSGSSCCRWCDERLGLDAVAGDASDAFCGKAWVEGVGGGLVAGATGTEALDLSDPLVGLRVVDDPLGIQTQHPGVAAAFGLESTGDAAYAVHSSVLGVPAMTLPLLREDNLPVGVQLMGFDWRDADLFAVAGAVEGIVKT